MRLRIGRRTWVTALSASVLALSGLAGVAIAAGTTLTFEVKGEYAKVKRTACHKTKPNWRAFHKTSTMEFRGFLLPPPASHFQVHVRVDKCVRGHWDLGVRNYYLVGENATDSHPGRYKGFYPAKPLAPRRRHHHRTVAYYRARASVGTLRTQEEYFLVRSG